MRASTALSCLNEERETIARLQLVVQTVQKDVTDLARTVSRLEATLDSLLAQTVYDDEYLLRGCVGSE